MLCCSRLPEGASGKRLWCIAFLAGTSEWLSLKSDCCNAAWALGRTGGMTT